MQYLTYLIVFILVSCSSQKELKKVNKKAELYYSQGTYYLSEGKYTEALTHLLEAKKLNPKDSRVYNNLAMAYYFKKRPDIALENLKHSLLLDPKNDDARLNLATIYLEKNRLDQAYKLYRQLRNSLTYNKQDQVLYNMAMLELKRNDSRQAKFYLKESLRENEFYCPSSFKIALLEYDKKQYKSAMGLFKKAIKGVCYNNPAAHFYLGVTYIKNKNIIEGITQLEQIQFRHPSSDYVDKAQAEINIARNLLSNREKEEMEITKKYNLSTPKF